MPTMDRFEEISNLERDPATADAFDWPSNIRFINCVAPPLIDALWEKNLLKGAAVIYEGLEHHFTPKIQYSILPNVPRLRLEKGVGRGFPLKEYVFKYSAPVESIVHCAVATAEELSGILTEINDFAFDVEQDEFGAVRPSYHAQKHCIRMVLALAKHGRLLRPSDISTDHNGAIRISWTSEGREAELICPSEEEQQPYLYFSTSDNFGTETDLTTAKIARRIRWALGQ